MAPEEGRNVRNKLIAITLTVIFMTKILASSKLYRLPKFLFVSHEKVYICLITFGSYLVLDSLKRTDHNKFDTLESKTIILLCT